jgi:hypothetical protein
VLCCSGGDDFEEVDEDENIDELDQQEVRTFREIPVFTIYRYWYSRFLHHACGAVRTEWVQMPAWRLPVLTEILWVFLFHPDIGCDTTTDQAMSGSFCIFSNSVFSDDPLI